MSKAISDRGKSLILLNNYTPTETVAMLKITDALEESDTWFSVGLKEISVARNTYK